MEAIDRLGATYQEIREHLESDHLYPDPDREDWREHSEDIGSLCELFDRDVLANLDDAALESDGEADALRAAVAALGGELAALVYASGKSGDALLRLNRLAEISSGNASDEIAAAPGDMTSYVSLVRGRWLLRNGDRGAAAEVLRPVAQCGEPALAKAAQSALDAPKPLQRAPELFSWNGFGLGMRGARDFDGDTQVSTYCLTALWLPVMPLTAYRVTDHGDGSYSFYSKEKLSRFAIWYRRLALGAVLVAIAAAVISSKLKDPNRLARKAIDEAAASAKAGKPDEAIRRYEKVLKDYGAKADRSVIARVGTALLALHADQVPSPLTVDQVGRAENVLRRYQLLPAKARGPASQELLAARVGTWVDELGVASVAAMQAGATLLQIAEQSSGNGTGKIAARHRALQKALAKRLRADWPMATLELYLDLGEDAAADELLTEIAAHPWLLASGERLVRAWLGRAERQSALTQKAEAVRNALNEAKRASDDPQHKKLLDGANAKALRAWAAQHPRDQMATVALATHALRGGDAASAVKLLQAAGKPGWLIPQARGLLAQAYLQGGELERADRLLSETLRLRLPRFLRASKRYDDAASSVHKQLVARAQSGRVPGDVRAKLTGSDEAAAREAFQAWASTEMERNSHLAMLKTEYVAYSDVVSLSIMLGTVKLQRANQVDGAERKKLLAQAERAFLAIRQDGAGMPSYHLGLGQVYHRLGRPKDGDKELEALLKGRDPSIVLEVARAYRELGITSRARSILKDLHERSSQQEIRYAAAGVLAIMSQELDERESWLKKADPKSPHIRVNLLELEAQKLFRAGKYAEADAVLSRIVARTEQEAKHNAVAANNTALSYQLRYLATGQRRHLRRAVKLLESSRQMRADNALVVGNLASVLTHLGLLEVLDALVRVDTLRLDGGSARHLIAALLEGPKGEALRRAIEQNKTLTRAAELEKEHAVLAPNQTASFAALAARYRELRDKAALRALRETLAAKKSSFDSTLAKAEHAAHIAGKRDAKNLEAARRGIVHTTQRVARATASRHRPALAAALYLHASALEDLAGETGERTDVTKAIEIYQRAHRAWPALRIDGRVALAKLSLAILGARSSSAALAKRWESERREYGVMLFVLRLSSEASSAPLLSVLRQRRELGEAAHILKASELPPHIGHWAVAKASGDQALLAKAKAAFTLEHARLSAEIAALLEPYDSRLAAIKAVFDSNKPR